jgi:hypothetical protein
MTPLFALLLAVTPQEAQFPAPARGGDPRSQRPWVFSGELGWNGLAGAGLVVARHLDPRFTLEAGLGISAEGAKVGLRGRYNLTVGEWTPFAGAGFLFGSGNGATQTEQSGGKPYSYSIGPSPFLQAVVGLECQRATGFNFLVAAGYARLLRQNLTITGSPTADDLSSLRIATGSGPVISASWGYAF